MNSINTVEVILKGTFLDTDPQKRIYKQASTHKNKCPVSQNGTSQMKMFQMKQVEFSVEKKEVYVMQFARLSGYISQIGGQRRALV